MPTIRDNAICIRTWDYSETSQTVCLFSRSHGMIRGLAKGSRRPKSNFSGGFEILSRGQVLAIVKPATDLANVIEWDLQEVYWAARQNLDAHRAGMYAIDLVYHLVTDHDPHEALFDRLADTLSGLVDTPRLASTLARFQYDILSEIGYRPRVEHDAETSRPLDGEQPTLAFSPVAGGIVADTGNPDRWRVRRETVQVLRSMARGEPIDCLGEHGAETLDRANRLLASYVRFIIGRAIPTMDLLFPDL